MAFQWASVTMCYYGITFSLASFSGNPRLNFVLGCVTELPGVAFAYFAMDFVGRRFLLTFLQGTYCYMLHRTGEKGTTIFRCCHAYEQLH